MPCDYKQITEDNIKAYGQETRHLDLFRRLYCQRTHFIYELIQNAEDAGAKNMGFTLWEDRLEIEHDGRLFNEKDVRGICGVGEGTKDKDLTKIGKFGVGFKSVYAFTDDPEVHCGDEHFRIESYVRPFSCKPRAPSKDFSTLVVLPFSGRDVKPGEAFKEIEDALFRLAPSTILFLKNIQVVTIESKMGQSRTLQRVRDRGNPAEVVLKCADKEDERWLVFERPVLVGGMRIRVEVGFQIGIDEKNNQKKKIVRVSKSPLVVFFPTEKETYLGFLIQGPYRTTPGRENIPKDNKENKRLIEETANLLVESLERLRDNGMLTVEVLQTLPIKPDHFEEGSMFRPIFDAVRDAFLDRRLLPGYSESDKPARFVSARQAKLAGSSELRRLLSSKQLSELFGTHKPAFWLSPDITPKTRDLWDYLKTVINIDELDPDGFVRRINEDFMKGQTDEWFVSFYRFLLGQRAWIRSVQDNSAWSWSVPFRDKPIIRLEDGRHIAPFNDDKATPAAHLPGSVQSGRATVKTIFAEREESREFLTAIGYTVPDIVDDVLELMLPRYASAATNIPDCYRSELELILGALKTDSESKKRRLRERLQECYWILAENAQNGEKALKRPGEIYFKENGMPAYFAGNPGAWFLDQTLGQFKNRFEEDVGVSRSVRISKKGSKYLDHVSITDLRGRHRRGLHGYDPEMKIDGLEFALSNLTPEKSAFIWNEIAIPHKKFISGQVESSRYSTYEESRTAKEPSEYFGRLLMERDWLLAEDGQFHKPADLSLADLPPSFTPDRGLSETLLMKSDALATLAKESGVDPEILNYTIKNPQTIKNLMQSEQKKVSPSEPHSVPPTPTLVQPHATATGAKGQTDSTKLGPPTPVKAGSKSPHHATQPQGEHEPLQLKDPETAEYQLGTGVTQSPGGGGGRGGGGTKPLSEEDKVKVEECGRLFAQRLLEDLQLGYIVEHMSPENPGYDLKAARDNEELRVEVKAHLGKVTVVDDLTKRQYDEFLLSKKGSMGYKWELWNIENLKDDADKVVITRYDDIPEEALDAKLFKVDLKKCIPTE